MRKIDYSLILTCYNEGPTFEKSLNKIYSLIRGLNGNWEIIFVEDGSIDNTKQVIERFVVENTNVRTIYHKRNLGRGKSVADGIMAAEGKVCGYMDVDCEVSPSYIPIFIKELEKGNDVVVGKRFYEGDFKSMPRVIASVAYAQMIKFFLNLPVDDTESGYKFFRRKSILPILKKTRDKHWFWDTEICARAHRAGLAIGQVPVLFIRRPEKNSTVKLFKDSFRYFVSLIKFYLEIKRNN